MKKVEIESWKCNILNNIKDDNPSVIYWGVDNKSARLISLVEEYLDKKMDCSFILVVYEVPDWNNYFSPWAVNINDGKIRFAGKGIETLRWLVDKCIPFIENAYKIKKNIKNKYVLGYSLSGLFALWSFYKSREFGGVACCSGSLWYPGWRKFVNEEKIVLDSVIYLSLGKKEEKTSNLMMKEVGNMTRWQYDKICEDEAVIYKELVWHNGGHFYQVEQRIIKAIEWLLDYDKNVSRETSKISYVNGAVI